MDDPLVGLDRVQNDEARKNLDALIAALGQTTWAGAMGAVHRLMRLEAQTQPPQTLRYGCPKLGEFVKYALASGEVCNATVTAVNPDRTVNLQVGRHNVCYVPYLSRKSKELAKPFASWFWPSEVE